MIENNENIYKYKNLSRPPKIVSKNKLFNDVQFQTTNTKCNLKCWFCPNSKRQFYNVPLKFANWVVIDRVIDELRRLNFRSNVGLYLQNEPFQDKRLNDIVSKVRNNVKTCTITMESNGLLLKPNDVVKYFRSGGNLFRINIYDKKHQNHFNKLASSIRKLDRNIIIDNKKSTYWGTKTKDRIFQLVDNYSPGAWKGPVKKRINRANNINIGELIEKYEERTCVRPFRHMFINYEGKVILCCNDWAHEAIMGDIMTTSLDEIWNNKKYFFYRFFLANKRRKTLKVCNQCNFCGGVHINMIYKPIIDLGKNKMELC